MKNWDQLFDQYLTGTLSAEELQEFLAQAAERGPEMQATIGAMLQEAPFSGTGEEEQRARILQAIIAGTPAIELPPNDPAPPIKHRVHFLKTAWSRYAAAIILIITGVAIYYNFLNISASDKNKVVHTVPPAAPNEIPPGTSRAVLTLSSGQKVELDSATSETIPDGTLSIKNIDGQLVYASGGTPATALPGEQSEAGAAGGGRTTGSMIALNTMTTPNGGQYQLTLSDGTKVWLNAASSITYPTAFKHKTREVTITGEVYFEVKKNPSKPFIVKTPEKDIVVLGTEFNVNAYEDEKAIKTSLVEGSVRIGNTILKPGNAYVDGKIVQTNVLQDVSWKNGYFYFDRTAIADVLKQLSRWYDVQVIYADDSQAGKRVSGKMQRSLNLSQVLDILQRLGLDCKLENRKLIVL